MNWKKLLTGLWRFAFVVGLIASGLLFLPPAGGYGYAIMALPLYGQICKNATISGVFDGKMSAEDYRVWLLNRGCAADTALRDVIADLNLDAPSERVSPEKPHLDPVKYAEYYNGRSRPTNADEARWLDVLREEMKSFKPIHLHLPQNPAPRPSNNDARERCLNECLGGETDPVEAARKINLCGTSCNTDNEIYRGMNRFCGNTLADHVICDDIIEPYGRYFAATFVTATNGGVDLMGGVLRSGSFLPAVLLLFYLTFLALLGSLIAAIGSEITKLLTGKR
jgi:hypothetical protein